MIRAIVLALALIGASAFAPAAAPTRRAAMRMEAESSRRNFGAAIAGAAGLGFARAANAEAGTGPKFSFFGLIPGSGTAYSENAAFGTDQSQPLYSAYGPFSPVDRPDALYKQVDNAPFYKKLIGESEKRLGKVRGYIEKKTWSEVITENTRQLYSLRKAMNGLAVGNKAAEEAKTAFYQDIEAVTLWSTRKDQAAAMAAYEKSLKDFAAYKSAVGI
eukprot:CAMPEP_0118973738 /NCGR_PEP_ID=MMETSP1173-20130426/10847_1 /TAXON_ID=1034831 /ORGANISM="Rhizochromulina marina cf, Strain CCMP1243" /LENGTH=216 /DNA_ID=CAMNT_0006923431 /DNA_START=35 /DNA_END=685 /DNA_ORIENTATION=-